MTIKFQRNYRLTIVFANSSQQLVIPYPLTVEFNINRSANAQLNTLDLKIFGLNKNTRNQIFQDWQAPGARNIVIFEAGYGDQLSVIFTGTIFQANSYRSGANVITYINSRDGWFDTATARSNFTLKAGANVSDVIARLANDFPNMNLAALGNIEGKCQSAVSVNGNTYQQIKKYSANQCFVDKEQLYVLKPNEYINGGIATIDASVGLINSPRRGQSYMTVPILFEPRLVIKQQVQLVSEVLPQYNGEYTVYGISHNGTISEAIGGDCTTTLEVYNPTIFGPLTEVATNAG